MIQYDGGNEKWTFLIINFFLSHNFHSGLVKENKMKMKYTKEDKKEEERGCEKLKDRQAQVTKVDFSISHHF